MTEPVVGKEDDLIQVKRAQNPQSARRNATRRNKAEKKKQKTVIKRIAVTLDELLSLQPEGERPRVPVEVIYTKTTGTVIWQVG